MENVKGFPGEYQHALVIVDIDKMKIRKLVERSCAERCVDQEAI